MKTVKTENRDLEITLEAALMLAEPGTAVPALAERIYDAEPRLMAELQREWMVERLTWLLHRRQGRVSAKNQLQLPGFEALPRRIELKDNLRESLYVANLRKLLQYRRILAQRRDRRLQPLDKLIDLVRPYSKEKGGKGITVARVMVKEMEKMERQKWTDTGALPPQAE